MRVACMLGRHVFRALCAVVPVVLSPVSPVHAPLYAQGSGTDAGNDFVAGTKVLYQNDFSTITVGMFPRTMRLLEGNAEVAKVGGRPVMRITGQPTVVGIPLAGMLPERFTLEFMLNGLEWSQAIWLVKPETSGFDWIEVDSDEGGVRTASNNFQAQFPSDSTKQWHRVRVMADGNYTKVYVDEVRVSNVPNANLGRSNAVYLALYGSTNDPVLIADVRLAAGGKDLYRALTEDGRFTMEGIEFDTGSDRLRPSSDSALLAVAKVMLTRADLTVEVEGHTDNVGAEAANQALSERRAKAVVAKLTALGVSATRLTAKGYGASNPIASNETPEGRQRNRRVELVRPGS